MAKPFKLQNQSIFVITEAPAGIYNPEQMKLIADICDQDSATMKVTEDQRIGLIIEESSEAAITTKLNAAGLTLRHYQDGVAQPVGCLGAHCPLSTQDALDTTLKLTESLSKIPVKAPIRVGVNGCSQCCVPSHTLDVSIIGEENGYRVSIGGKNSQIPEMASFVAEAVPADKIVEHVQKAITIYSQNAEDDESLHSMIERMGAGSFIEAFAPYSQDAANDGTDPFSDLAAAPTADLSPEIFTAETDTSTATESTEAGAPTEDVLIEEPFMNELPESNPSSESGEDLLEDVGTESKPAEDEELALEAKVAESVAEQAAIAEMPKDENVEERDQALNFMEHKADESVTSFDQFDHEVSIDDEAQEMDSGSSDQNGFDFIQSININDEFATLVFEKGASITVDLSKLRDRGGHKSLRINGQEVTLRIQKNVLQVVVDGVEISLPETAAAA